MATVPTRVTAMLRCGLVSVVTHAADVLLTAL
jgi:hypothetical protein